ncbi:MAG TPA: molybdopterin molybdotransferase MoeA [Clostridiales bacterium]|nr:MAG: Molybdopterin molybdenumtransferase [Firmicutes bacterium ADurb.Bin262]HQK74204.1 molybdopterin molybdotransferase MoeA [Clostridiales bacterium]
MLEVASPRDVLKECEIRFGKLDAGDETVSIFDAGGRVLFEDVAARENIPGFDRSTVDGFAVRAADTFGCSTAIPAQLRFCGGVAMGEGSPVAVGVGECAAVPTGGMLPEGADAVVMVEDTEDYGDGCRYILKPVSPGANLVRKGEEAAQGKTVIRAGTALLACHVGALAALGVSLVRVWAKPVAGIISTGDEIVPVDAPLSGAKVRDVNTHMLYRLAEAAGAKPLPLGICPDGFETLTAAVEAALPKCGILLISGGSSAGEMDVTAKVIAGLGEVYVHGIAAKPGKPTVIGEIAGKPVFGLPGHPVSAYFSFLNFAMPVIASMAKIPAKARTTPCVLGADIPSNHGREEYIPVRLSPPAQNGSLPEAMPVRLKSGLIALLGEADGYIVAGRDSEGLFKGERAEVHPLL